MDLKKLETERRNKNTMDLDTKSTEDILYAINNEDQKIPDVVRGCIGQISTLVDASFERLNKGGRIFYIGAGTSGRLGVLDASECPPTYGVSFECIQGLIAGGYDALLKAKEGAEDDLTLAKKDLIERNFGPNDTLIGLAASGRTPYVIGGLQYANEIGALTGSISCVSNAEISKYATYPIEAITGPEVVTGSTRMKAGTCQKLILNMISTSLMIKYGKVYQNLMVDVQPTNEKLVIRACRIISEATGCSQEEAKIYLEKSHHQVKLAIVMYLTQKELDECQTILNNHHGNVSQTIHTLLKG